MSPPTRRRWCWDLRTLIASAVGCPVYGESAPPQAMSVGGIAVLEVVLTHKAFKLAEGPLRKRFPAPEWLRRRFDEATQKRRRLAAEQELRRSQGPSEASRRSQGSSEESRRARAKAEEPRRPGGVTDAVVGVTQLHGARQLAQDRGGGAAKDAYQGKGVLALVLELDRALLTRGGPIVSVWAATHKRGS